MRILNLFVGVMQAGCGVLLVSGAGLCARYGGLVWFAGILAIISGMMLYAVAVRDGR